MSDVRALANAYLAALNAGDLDRVLALFDEGATVRSPLYGTQPASDFYAALFKDTQRSQTTLGAVFADGEDPRHAAFHFNYVWTLASGAVVTFDVVDLVRLTDDGRRFAELTIVYDTAPLREEFSALR